MKHTLSVLLTSAALITSANIFALGSDGTGTIKATLTIFQRYSITTTPLVFGDHTAPASGTEKISIAPGSKNASTLTINGSNGEASVSLGNSGVFQLTGQNTKESLRAVAYFKGNESSQVVTLANNVATTSVGASTQVLASTKVDDYNGTVTVNVTKNI